MFFAKDFGLKFEDFFTFEKLSEHWRFCVVVTTHKFSVIQRQEPSDHLC